MSVKGNLISIEITPTELQEINKSIAAIERIIAGTKKRKN